MTQNMAGLSSARFSSLVSDIKIMDWIALKKDLHGQIQSDF